MYGNLRQWVKTSVEEENVRLFESEDVFNCLRLKTIEYQHKAVRNVVIGGSHHTTEESTTRRVLNDLKASASSIMRVSKVRAGVHPIPETLTEIRDKVSY